LVILFREEGRILNAILKFIQDGGSLTSEEGLKLVHDSGEDVVREAAADARVMEQLGAIMDMSCDPYTKRIVMQVLSSL